MIALTVVREFDGFEKGASITDPVTIAKILGGHNQRDVLKVNAPDIPVLSEQYLETGLASGVFDGMKTFKPSKTAKPNDDLELIEPKESPISNTEK